MTIRFTRRRLLVPLVATAMAASVAFSGAAHAETEEPTERAIVLAELGYTNGVAAVFTIDEQSRDLGFVQDGATGRNGPLLDDREGSSFLDVYLAITPPDVAVPREIVDSHPAGTPLPAEMQRRKVTTDVVRVGGLTAPTTTAATITCWSKYYGWVQWYDPAGNPNPMSVHHPWKTYWAKVFGGRKQYSNSFVANCGNANARHRIYYWTGHDWKKHWDSVIIPGHWQAKTKGSVLRWRKVTYDEGWGYTRAGRFRN